MQNVLWAAVAAGLVGVAGSAHANIIADSAGDFALGQSQGFNGWSYGFFDGDSANPFTADDFEEMTLASGTFWADPGRVWTGGTGQWLHPNADNITREDDVHHAVRRWTSYVSGDVTLSGDIWHQYDTPMGDGTLARILVDGVEVFSHTLTPGDNLGDSYSVNVTLAQGSVIDYVVSAGPSNDGQFDTTFFTSRIEAIPGPGALAVLGLAGLALGRRR
jgi:hypothetical protein